MAGKQGLHFRGNKPPNAGRKKGTLNKVTQNVKEIYELAFERLGGASAFVEWANRTNENRTEFYKMFSKLLPRDVNLLGDNVKIIYVSGTKDKEQKFKGLTKSILGDKA